MAKFLKSPGIQIDIKDFTQYSVTLLGNNVLVPFVSNKGPVNEPIQINSATEFLNIFGTPTTDSAFAAYSISKYSPIIAIRLAWIYDGQTLDSGSDLYSYLTTQGSDNCIDHLKVRNGAFDIHYNDGSTDTSLLKGYIVYRIGDRELLNPGTWANDLSILIEPITFTGTSDDSIIETLNFYLLLNGTVIESFSGLEIQVNYEESANQIERVINNQSKYIKIVSGSYEGLKTVTLGDLKSTANTFVGIDTSNIVGGSTFSAYDIKVEDYNLYTLENTNNVFKDPITHENKITNYDDIFSIGTFEGSPEITENKTQDYVLSTFDYLSISSLKDENIIFNMFYTDIAKNYETGLKTLYTTLQNLAEIKWFFSFVNIPLSNTTAVNAANWVTNNYNSWYKGATYWPSAKYYNSYTYKLVEMGTSFTGIIAALYSDSISYPWFASAGLNRGIVSSASVLTYNPNKDDRDLLYYYPNRINPIRKIPNQGIVVWGNKTLQTKPSALDSVNVVRLFIYLAHIIDNSVQYLVFEPITRDLFIKFKELLTPIMDEVKSKKGLYDYVIIADMNAGGNTPETIQKKEVHVAIGVKPTFAAEYIYVSFIVTPQGADFADFIK